MMKSPKFKRLKELLGHLHDAGHKAEFVSGMRDMHGLILQDFSASAAILYREMWQISQTTCPDIDLPDLFDGIRLRELFERDPSDASVLICLALKEKEDGNPARSRQLLRRVAHSGYRERHIAQLYLQTQFDERMD